jgi:hypothetical protein
MLMSSEIWPARKPMRIRSRLWVSSSFHILIPRHCPWQILHIGCNSRLRQTAEKFRFVFMFHNLYFYRGQVNFFEVHYVRSPVMPFAKDHQLPSRPNISPIVCTALPHHLLSCFPLSLTPFQSHAGELIITLDSITLTQQMFAQDRPMFITAIATDVGINHYPALAVVGPHQSSKQTPVLSELNKIKW